MSETKWTKLDWRLAGAEIVCSLSVIATVCQHAGLREEDEANGHLLAAAPDLYEALCVALYPLRVAADNIDPMFREKVMANIAAAEAALSKARGETETG